MKQLFYTLNFHGLFGRNRKEKFESFPLTLDVPLDAPLNEIQLKVLTVTKLDSIKAKRGKWHVTVNEETLEELDGIVFRTVAIKFNQTNRVLNDEVNG